MKKLLFVMVFTTICVYANAQMYVTYGSDASYDPYVTYKPIESRQRQQPAYNYQPQTYQPQVSYMRVTGVSKNGRSAVLKVKYIDGQLSSVEYFDTTYKRWTRCAAISKTNKYFYNDNYEQVYDYKVQTQPQLDNTIFYF